MAYRDDPQVQTMIGNMPEKTGKTLQEWMVILQKSGLQKHGEMMKLLKGEYGVTHGFANTICMIYRQEADGGPPVEEDLVGAQYSGPKVALLPVYEKILEEVKAFGSDVEIAPKKSYVSLRRSKQFAIVQPSTRSRVDLGLNLKNAEATDRLQGGVVFNGMCTHKVALNSPGDVDGEVVGWLKRAYEEA